jgi:hypothetical protein
MRLLSVLAFLLAAFGLASVANAQLTFQLRTGDPATNVQSMPIDSNNCAASGPRAMYVGGSITNSGATTVNNIAATMSGVTGNFALGQATTQSVGSIGARQSTGVYWHVDYGCSVTSVTSTIGITSSAAAVSRAIGLSTKSSISANAGGNVLSSALGPGAVVGQTIYFDASYDFGGSSVGDEFILQPSGSQAFDAVCFRLAGTEIRASNIAPIVVGTTNRIYFRQTQTQSGNGYFATVRYYFEYQCAGATTTARPYATMTSGNSLKYTGNYDGSGRRQQHFGLQRRAAAIPERSHSLEADLHLHQPRQYDRRHRLLKRRRSDLGLRANANSVGADALVNRVRIRPKGAMGANSSFTLLFGYIVN